MKGAKHSEARQRVGAPDVRGRFTLAQARDEGRCECEGCEACRGLVGYPCASVVIGDALKCRYCR